MTMFGIVTMLQGFVQNFGGLMATRWFLGVCEAGGYMLVCGVRWAYCNGQACFRGAFTSWRCGTAERVAEAVYVLFLLIDFGCAFGGVVSKCHWDDGRNKRLSWVEMGVHSSVGLGHFCGCES